MILRLMTFAACLFLFGQDAAAHGPNGHKGQEVSGIVKSILEDGFQMEGADAPLSVILDEATVVLAEPGGAVATREALEPGTEVTVVGTKLTSGKLHAKEIQIKGRPRGDVPRTKSQNHGLGKAINWGGSRHRHEASGK